MTGFQLPPYPYDGLIPARAVAKERFGAAIDMSVGTPFDAPPQLVLDAIATSNSERGYPPSIGTAAFRDAAASWLDGQFGVQIDPQQIGATIGLKEFVAGLPHWLRLRTPDRDTVLYPSVSYPSYAMGADLAGCRAVPVPVDEQWRLRAAWGREHGVPVFSDECYIEFTWDGPGRTILQTGEAGVVAVHSLSKRSNLAGMRSGFYAGDAELVHWLQEIRKHSGFMTPGPTQAAAIAALGDQHHVEQQRDRYWHRLQAMSDVVQEMGLDAPLPGGGFYLWVPAPDGDAWALTNRFAEQLGLIVSPGEFYGPDGAGHIRIAVVRPDEDIETVRQRL